jgi:uncharacterized protein YjbI with pentapeptide repeats
MRFEIKHRYLNEVLFSIETGTLKLAVEAAIKSGADLTRADLAWANLTRADLARANLTRADLAWANLTRADLAWANLTGANLSWANLTGANLSGADLSGANLTGADLYGYISIGPIGSRQSYLWTRWEEGGFKVKTGCFDGTLDNFKKAVQENHKSGVHRDEYIAAIKLIEVRMESSRADWEKHRKEKKS